MPMRERTPTPTALPSPAPLPSLTSAFSRRTAIFGAMLVGTASASAGVAAAVLPCLPKPADARLIELAKAYEALDRQVNATPSTTPGFDDLVDAFSTMEDELASTPAETMEGILAKARTMRVPACRDCAVPALGDSLADDLVRLYDAVVLL